MIHMGRNTRSTIISKGISAGYGSNTYRGLVRVTPKAVGARHYKQCDSLLIGDKCAAHTFSTIEARNPPAHVDHKATTSRPEERREGKEFGRKCKHRWSPNPKKKKNKK